jgi:hypothetical protein
MVSFFASFLQKENFYVGKFLLFTVQDDTIIFLLEIFHSVFLGQSMLEADDSTLASSLLDIVA